MINGIIKLFYSEVVKTKIKNMQNNEYTFREEYEDIRNITLKVDSLFFKIIKFMVGILLLAISFEINIKFAIGVLLIEVAYLLYKFKLESQVLEAISDIKSNIEFPSIDIISERGKSGINALMILLLIGLITNFNWSIVISFIVVFIFTIKDIYSNIK
ncbi:MAG: hypothetical protein IJ086_11355 [Clostridium sp.]|nr:hypothetical protein [Clostridium sp.]